MVFLKRKDGFVVRDIVWEIRHTTADREVMERGDIKTRTRDRLDIEIGRRALRLSLFERVVVLKQRKEFIKIALVIDEKRRFKTSVIVVRGMEESQLFRFFISENERVRKINFKARAL